MILIADSGSTKTDWVLVNDNGQIQQRLTTAGINPYHQTDEEIVRSLPNLLSCGSSRASELPLQWERDGGRLFFYGSGCTPEQSPRIQALLMENLKSLLECEVYSDLLGAARAVCGKERGIACILGTGANSCLYDGERIVQNTPALGYILGDEGSGAVLGRRLLNALYKGRLPQHLREAFEQEMSLTMSDVIERVYRQPMANRFLASLSPFVARHLDEPELRNMVIDHFREFLRHNIVPYNAPQLLIGFVGSMAFHYQAELREAAHSEGFVLGDVMKSPIDGLLRYHFPNS